MKGKLVLKPIDKPVEGIKAVTLFFGHNTIVTINKVLDAHCIIYGRFNEHIVHGEYPLSELNQVVIEYDGSTILSGPGYIETLPLHPDDWKKALPLIGQEVEAEQELSTKEIGRILVDGSPISVENAIVVARLLTAKKETWEDIFGIAYRDYIKGNKNPDAFPKWLMINYHPPKPIKQ